MLKVGLIGWRGMVGSVLCQRFTEEGDWASFEPHFFSTSQAGAVCPLPEAAGAIIKDANNLDELSKMDILLSCQGGDYTKAIHHQLRDRGYRGYWIDSASALRMDPDSIIVLDPVNRDQILTGLQNGIKDYIGGNCTVSLLLMALNGLIRTGAVEWISSMTYQAASGAGAAFMSELLAQNAFVGRVAEMTGNSALAKELAVREAIKCEAFPTKNIGVPLATSLIPWIDSAWDKGQTREEWKAMAEGNKILGYTDNRLLFDGLCVRVGSLRCHSQALTIKLRQPMEIPEIEDYIAGGNEWVKYIPNEMDPSRRELTPAAVSGSLTVAIGRLHHMLMGKDYITAFTVGDQLLWGAAEPLRRVLRIIISQIGAN